MDKHIQNSTLLFKIDIPIVHLVLSRLDHFLLFGSGGWFSHGDSYNFAI